MNIILPIMLGFFSVLIIFAAVVLGFRIGSGSWPWKSYGQQDAERISGKLRAERPRPHGESGSKYLVAVWRDEPFRHIIDIRDSLTDAARLSEHFRQQWSHVYLAEVIAGEGPEGHAIVERLSIMTSPMDKI